MLYNFNKIPLLNSECGIFKKDNTEVGKILDQTWDYINNTLDMDMLWKLGVYTNKVVGLENNERGMFIERFFCEQLKGENLDDINANKLRIKGHKIKHDFTLPNNLRINVKTTCVQNRLFNRIGQISSSKSIKIFDTSRNKYINDQRMALIRQLDSIGWDVNILLYGYEKLTNRYSLHLTSLKEITETLLGNSSNENIIRLFSFSKGGSHYFIDRANIHYVAKLKKRQYFSGNVDKNIVDDYILRKRNGMSSYLELLS